MSVNLSVTDLVFIGMSGTTHENLILELRMKRSLVAAQSPRLNIIINSKGGHIFGGLTIELHEQNSEQKKRIAELEELLVLKETLYF